MHRPCDDHPFLGIHAAFHPAHDTPLALGVAVAVARIPPRVPRHRGGVLMARLGPVVALQGDGMAPAGAACKSRAFALEGVGHGFRAGGAFSEDAGEEAFQEGLEGGDAGAHDGCVDFDSGPDQ